MADSADVQVFVNEHHKKCMDALIKIAKLTRGYMGDSDSGFPYASLSQIAFHSGSIISQVESIAREITG